MANKIAQSSRLDFFATNRGNEYGEEFKKQVEERMNFLSGGEKPRKNVEAMKEVSEKIIQSNKDDLKKSKKSKKKQEEESDDENSEESSVVEKKKSKKKKDRKESVVSKVSSVKKAKKSKKSKKVETDSDSD